jgi:hypothetical protein
MSLISRLNEQPPSTLEKIEKAEIVAIFRWLTPLQGEVWELGNGHREQRLSNADVAAVLYTPTRFPYKSLYLTRRVADAMKALGWVKAVGSLRCHRDRAPERGYRRPACPAPPESDI